MLKLGIGNVVKRFFTVKNIIKLEVVVCSFVLFFFFISYCIPRIKHISRLKHETKLYNMGATDDLTLKIQKIKDMENDLKQKISSLKKQLDSYNRFKLYSQNYIWQQETLLDLTQKLIALADASEIELTNIEPKIIAELNGLQTISVYTGFKCSYDKLVQFLKTIYRASFLTGVDKLVIANNENTYPDLEVKLNVSALFRVKNNKSMPLEEGK